MRWYKVILVSEEVASGKDDTLQMRFNNVFDKSGNPKEAALFMRDLDGGGETEVFISPKAAELGKDIIQEFSAVACDKPAKDKLYLLLGQPNAQDILL